MGNFYKHVNYNIEVSVYKSFPNWEFETFGQLFIEKYLAPMILKHINLNEKVIILMHTEDAWISHNLKKMYDEEKLNIDDLKNYLILFGENDANLSKNMKASRYYIVLNMLLRICSKSIPLVKIVIKLVGRS